MLTIHINQPELHSLELIRVGLSEESSVAREKAIKAIKHDIIGMRPALLDEKYGPDWTHEPKNSELARWLAASVVERHEAIHEFSDVKKRYEQKNERKLNVAERIGKRILHTIRDGKYEGVQTPNGILKQVSDDARDGNVSGGKDKDVLRKIWSKYRGLVHLGMAIDFCEDNPNQNECVLHIAERIRRKLSQNCPKGTSAPYVNPKEQIYFLYISAASGPRFRNRGLPFGVS